MDDYANDEFRRILSNPGNEIISDSLKERLSYSEKSINFSISFGDSVIECSLDSFSISPLSNKISRISLLVNSEVASSILSMREFAVSCSNLDIQVDSSDVENIECFKYNQDTYSLELSLGSEEIIND
tara:strand:- start:1917 stop:2300 length:384 start_codon:yes stop_codon:yes gene_type:complete